jgi:hypothetical protein
VVHGGLPNAGCLPVGAELLQVLVDRVNRLVHLVHAVLQTIPSPLQLSQCEEVTIATGRAAAMGKLQLADRTTFF